MLANQVELIKHWKIRHKSYDEIDTNQSCTWFIDPPYSQAGKRYRNNNIDYPKLAAWCKERQGQTIVCEQSGANWLDFYTFQKVTNGSNKKYEEVMWTNQSFVNCLDSTGLFALPDITHESFGDGHVIV
jgi:16S rRNA G966 N2-methylase RsmD